MTRPLAICSRCGGVMDRTRYIIDCGRLVEEAYCRLDDEISVPVDPAWRRSTVTFSEDWSDPDDDDYSDVA